MSTAKRLDLRTLAPEPKLLIVDNGTPEGEEVDVTSLKLGVQVKALTVRQMMEEGKSTPIEQFEAMVELLASILHKDAQWVEDNIDTTQMEAIVAFIADNARTAVAENGLEEAGGTVGEAPEGDQTA
jgi:hypothetical protein